MLAFLGIAPKKRAKVLLFFEIRKFFRRKMLSAAVFLLFATFVLLLRLGRRRISPSLSALYVLMVILVRPSYSRHIA